MTNYFVIFNPAARSEKSRRLQQFLPTQATVAATTGPGDAQRLAAQAARAGYPCVVAAGGDGTVNEVVNGLGPHGPALGVLPLGTVNVFARELGLPRRLDAAWAVIAAGRTRTMDLGCATARGVSRYFVQLAGVGFDAWAVQHASGTLKKRIGPMSYVWAGLKAVATPCAPVAVGEHRGVAVLVGNGRFYGGRFLLFPRARLDDGLLDVCVFERGRYVDVLRYVVAVARGRHARLPDVRYFQAAEFECRAVAGSAPVEVDGELAGHAPVRFAVVPGALRVRC